MYFPKFKLVNSMRNYSTIKRCTPWNPKVISLFCSLFDLTLSEYKAYRALNKLPVLSEKHLVSNAALCESFDIPKKEWLKYPILLKETANSLEQRYVHLKEGGFVKVDAKILAEYRRYVRKTIYYLKAFKHIPSHINVAESFLSHLTYDQNFSTRINFTDMDQFETVYRTILTRYLMWKFQVTEDVVEKFYRINRLSQIKSFKQLSENFILADQLGFPPQKVRKYGYMLMMYPKCTSRLLKDMPTIVNVDIREAIKSCPKLICVPFENFHETYNHLKKFKVSDETIRNNINVFTLSPSTVKARLEELYGIPEFKVLIDHPHFLKLVIHHSEVRSRLSFFREAKLKCASAARLCLSNDNFDMYIRANKDVYSSKEIVGFLCRLLKSRDPRIETNLKKHPYYRNVSFVQIEQSYKLLQKLKFEREQIIDVVQLLLYPSDKIQKAYMLLVSHRKSGRNVRQIEKLNLLLYFIESDYHFTGNGIWDNNKNT